MTEFAATRASWCNLGVGFIDNQGNINFQPDQKTDEDIEHQLPELTTNLDLMYLSMESLLTRQFNFPLKHVRHLDASMLAQELADTVGIEPDDWWFTWRAEKTENGVSGIVFGIPKTMKQAIQENNEWQQIPMLLVDGWERLNQWLSADELNDSIAVIDVDAEGVFFGLYQYGVWKGMRRLNGDMNNEETCQLIAQQALWSLQSMGILSEDVQVLGNTNKFLADAFNQNGFTIQDISTDELSSRHALNLKLPAPSKSTTNHLNLRHSKWSVRRKSSVSREWLRPSLLAAGVCFLWLSLTSIHNQQLETQIDNMNGEIIAAFHKGLPDQSVIIDALAQLKQAVGTGGSNTGNASLSVSNQLATISKVFTKQTWQMQELSMDKNGILIAGKVSDLNTLNTIRDDLEKETGTSVKVSDTDLKDDEVAFRVRWQ